MDTNLQMNGPGTIAKDNDFSENKNAHITNHIYLHQNASAGEYNDWMRKIGSLIRADPDYAVIQPFLNLIVTILEPDRLFLISHEEIPELDSEKILEILVVLQKSNSISKRMINGLLNTACFKEIRVVVHVTNSEDVHMGIENAHCHYAIFCTEDNLIFSNNPYRLAKPPALQLATLKNEMSNKINKLLTQARLFLEEAEMFAAKQSSNLAALMLYYCVEYTYKNLLFEYNNKLYKTISLTKLQFKVNAFLPQVCSQLDSKTIYILEDIAKHATAPLYDNKEVWDAHIQIAKVSRFLEVLKVTFEKRLLLI